MQSQSNRHVAKSQYAALDVDFLTSFYCDITIAQLFDGPFDCDVIKKKFAYKWDVEHLVTGHLHAQGTTFDPLCIWVNVFWDSIPATSNCKFRMLNVAFKD